MEGAIELAEEIFHVPVRLGVPGQVNGLGDVIRNPIYSTGVGLLQYARENTVGANRVGMLANNVAGMYDRMRGWFRGYF